MYPHSMMIMIWSRNLKQKKNQIWQTQKYDKHKNMTNTQTWQTHKYDKHTNMTLGTFCLRSDSRFTLGNGDTNEQQSQPHARVAHFFFFFLQRCNAVNIENEKEERYTICFFHQLFKSPQLTDLAFSSCLLHEHIQLYPAITDVKGPMNLICYGWIFVLPNKKKLNRNSMKEPCFFNLWK